MTSYNDKIEILPNVKGLIFDCDGTLVDSMQLHIEAWKNTLQSFNAEWDYDLFYSARGMKELEIVTLYNRKYGTKLIEATIIEEKHNYFRKHINKLNPIPFVADIAIKNKNILPMAVVSGGTREIVTAELEVIGILNLFDVILTADDNFNPKPDPDLFLEAAKRLNVLPEECQVFEDAELGIKAAESAGMIITDVRKYF